MAKRVIIDTDPGIDDALALILALRSPELRVEAVTTVSGNVHVDLTTRNALRVLHLLRPDPRPAVARGADRPLKRPLQTAPEVYGKDGLGNLDRCRNPDGTARYPEPRDWLLPAPAPDVLLDLVARHPGEITLVTLGPLTNVARAILADRRGMARLRELIVMGGAIAVPGNTTPAAEFNIYVDPEAAEIVLESGIPTTLVGLDVTRRVRLEASVIESRLRPAGGPVAQLVCDMAPVALEFGARMEGGPAITLHDPLAVAVAIDPSLIATRTLPVRVETAGAHTAGMTVADLRSGARQWPGAPRIQVAMDVDAERFLRLFLDRLCPT